MMNSDCCGVLIFRGICMRCKEHAEPMGDSDDGYDALKDNYLTGTGPAYNEKTRQAERDEAENDRQSRHY